MYPSSCPTGLVFESVSLYNVLVVSVTVGYKFITVDRSYFLAFFLLSHWLETAGVMAADAVLPVTRGSSRDRSNPRSTQPRVRNSRLVVTASGVL